MGQLASRTRQDVEAQRQQAGQRPATTGAAADVERGLYFGPHFVMGGHEYAAAPDAFLFGGLTADFSPVTAFGLSRIGHPTPELQTTTTLRSNVHLKRNTVKLTAVPATASDGGETGQPTKYGLSFVFDADVPCTVQLFIASTESINAKRNVIYTPARPEGHFPVFSFGKGLGQKFTLPQEHLIDLSHYVASDLQVEHEDHVKGIYPLVILISAIPATVAVAHNIVPGENAVSHQISTVPPGMLSSSVDSMQTESTLATFTTLSGAVRHFDAKVLKQKIVVHGVSFILQDIFGIEQSPEQGDSSDNTRECVVCMSDPKDTIVLPCRHLCLCSQCAEQLRYQSNKCPICRQPFHALLQIKVGNKVRSPAAGSTAPEPAAVVSDPVPASPALRPSENIWQQAAMTGEVQLSDLRPLSQPAQATTTTYTPVVSFGRSAGASAATQLRKSSSASAEEEEDSNLDFEHDDDGDGDGDENAASLQRNTSRKAGDRKSAVSDEGKEDDDAWSGDELMDGDDVVDSGAASASITKDDEEAVAKSFAAHA